MNTKRSDNETIARWAASEKAIGHYMRSLRARKANARNVVHGRGAVRDGCQCAECKAAGMNQEWTPSVEWLDAQALAIESRKRARKAAAAAAYDAMDIARTTVAWCLRKRDGKRVYKARQFPLGVPAFVAAW